MKRAKQEEGIIIMNSCKSDNVKMRTLIDAHFGPFG